MLVAVLLHDRVSLIDRGFRKVRHIFHPRDSPIPPRWLPRLRAARPASRQVRGGANVESALGGLGVLPRKGSFRGDRGILGPGRDGRPRLWSRGGLDWFRALGSRSRSLRARPSQG
jgi:hypothetical protein